MSRASKSLNFNFQTPATYRIRVKGTIDPAWLEILGGMCIETVSKGKDVVTTLAGRVVDQAALAGVLKTLYDQRVPLLSVENLDEKKGRGKRAF